MFRGSLLKPTFSFYVLAKYLKLKSLRTDYCTHRHSPVNMIGTSGFFFGYCRVKIIPYRGILWESRSSNTDSLQQQQAKSATLISLATRSSLSRRHIFTESHVIDQSPHGGRLTVTVLFLEDSSTTRAKMTRGFSQGFCLAETVEGPTCNRISAQPQAYLLQWNWSKVH